MVKKVSKVDNPKVKPKGKPKGYAKTGGRKAGTPNVNSKAFREAVNDSGYHLVKTTLDTIMEIEDPKIRLPQLMTLFKYIYPTLKDVESPDVDGIQGLDGLSDDNLINLAKLNS